MQFNAICVHDPETLLSPLTKALSMRELHIWIENHTTDHYQSGIVMDTI